MLCISLFELKHRHPRVVPGNVGITEPTPFSFGTRFLPHQYTPQRRSTATRRRRCLPCNAHGAQNVVVLAFTLLDNVILSQAYKVCALYGRNVQIQSVSIPRGPSIHIHKPYCSVINTYTTMCCCLATYSITWNHHLYCGKWKPNRIVLLKHLYAYMPAIGSLHAGALILAT
jgi:hypothetical protein